MKKKQKHQLSTVKCKHYSTTAPLPQHGNNIYLKRSVGGDYAYIQ